MRSVNLFTVILYRNGGFCGRFDSRLWDAADTLATYWRARLYTVVIARE